MAEDLPSLLTQQSTVIASIKQVLPNFKKLSKTNITLHKVKKHLDDLDTLWNACQRLNIRLLQIVPTERQRIEPYFAEHDFRNAMNVCREAEFYITNVLRNLGHREHDPVTSRYEISMSSRDERKATKRACGAVGNSDKQNLSIASIIQNRSIGDAFSVDKIYRSNIFLPNKTIETINYGSYHNGLICSSYSKDGRFFFAANKDWLRIFHTQNGEFVQFKKIKNTCLVQMDYYAFSPDGNTIVNVSKPNTSHNYHLIQCSVFGDSNEFTNLPKPMPISGICIKFLVFSNDGREILCGCTEGHIYVYDREHQWVSKIRLERSTGVSAFAFADDASQIFYSGNDRGICKIWDKRTLSENDPRPVGMLVNHTNDNIRYIDSRGDGRYFITMASGIIKLWDVRTMSDKTDQPHYTCRSAIAEYGFDFYRKYYREVLLKDDTSVMTYRNYFQKDSRHCHFSPAATTGQRYIYAGYILGGVIIYDVLTGKIVRKLCDPRKEVSNTVSDVNWHPYYPQIVSGPWNGTIVRWLYDSDTVELEDKVEINTEVKPWTLRRSERIVARRRRSFVSNVL